MARRRLPITLATALVAIAFSVPATAHEMTVHGTVTAMYPDQLETGLFVAIEGLAPGALPNGVFYHRIDGVEGGDRFAVTADHGQSAIVCGGPCLPLEPEECPGPDWSPEGLLTGEDEPEDVWLFCHNWPDFDVKFTNGVYGNGPGDEAGTVPGSGAAMVTLYFGDPYREREAGDLGEGFTYAES